MITPPPARAKIRSLFKLRTKDQFEPIANNGLAVLYKANGEAVGIEVETDGQSVKVDGTLVQIESAGRRVNGKLPITLTNGDKLTLQAW